MSKDHKNKYSRRKFLGTASCAAIGSTTFFSTLFNLQAMNASSLMSTRNVTKGEDYKALVCIMLGGGNDSFNMLVPRDNMNYGEYAATRSNLALDQNALLALSPNNYNEKELGFHPAMPELQTLFNEGKLAALCNVGTLVQPTNKTDYINNSNLPQGLFSHADQAHHWQTSIPQAKNPTGWAGRLADLLQSANTNQDISMNISLGGKNVFQVGDQSSEYSILPIGNGSSGIQGYEGNTTFDQVRTGIVNSLMEKQYQDIFKQTYADVIVGSQNAHELFSGALSTSDVTTTFSNTILSQNLKMVARTIQAREQLGMKRQTFYVSLDGWDHHGELLNNHSLLLAQVSAAMGEFQNALEEIGAEECVTTFTVSDFGRTLSSNGNGSDHAWGGNVLVMGDQVKGKEIYGSYPSLALNSDILLNVGVVLPQISTDEYFAELALWYGVSSSELNSIFPNLGNFYNAMSGNAPIGFMNI